jgi:4-amino-4-deoxy-L-arabinose transferase-like glycosyltransferase
MPTPNALRIALALGLAAYAALLATWVGAVPGGSDTSGYFNEARLFARGRIQTEERVLPGLPPADVPPYLYVPLGFKPVGGPGARMVPTYPPGLPLLLVAAARLVGWRHAGDCVLILHALAGVVLTYALGRRCGLPRSWALAGSAVLAASPLYLYTSLWALSDVPATAWATAAVLAAWSSREKPAWSLASGLCLGVAFLVRPNNVLIVLPIAIILGPSPLRLLGVAAAALPGIVAWMAINRVAYGAPLQSGYGAIGNEFHASLIPGTFLFCARWLPLLLSPLVVPAPAVVALLGRRTRVAASLAAWIALYVAFYLPYRWTHEDWWFLRFLLPAAPALIVAGLLVLEAVRERWLAPASLADRRRLVAGLLLMALGVEAFGLVRLDAWAIGRGESKYLRVAQWLDAHLPRNAAVVAQQYSGSLYYYTPFTLLRPDQLNASVAPRVRAAARAAGRPIYAVLFPFETASLSALPGRWAIAGSVEDVVILRLGEAPPPAGP